MKIYEIATLEGDGIGPEVCQAAVQVMKRACDETVLSFTQLEGGAGAYLKHGEVLPAKSFDACQRADAIFHGAAGIPEVTYPDGTEVGNDLHLRLRFRLDLYANVRPIKLYQPEFSPLKNMRAGGIDYVIVRENTEGLYASRGAGTNLRGEVVTDTLVMTRKGIERVVKFAFDLAKGRQGAPLDSVRRVTVCDKANILRSYAFFRAISKEVAANYPDVEIDYAYVDAMTVHLVKRPDFYDVIVAENMFGDIISDLGAATVGGMGIAASAELGDHHGLFQGAHGSAPDIAGKGIANSFGQIWSGAMMLERLGQPEAAPTILQALETVVQHGPRTRDLAGTANTIEVDRGIATAVRGD